MQDEKKRKRKCDKTEIEIHYYIYSEMEKIYLHRKAFVYFCLYTKCNCSVKSNGRHKNVEHITLKMFMRTCPKKNNLAQGFPWI